ncbi:dinucleotide-utilizing protein [Polaribacter reichenbachii]|uniref:Molybdopterin-synthase adenylyltransferase n=1 Tax=Polaribacter reichenbachii TaxID=996801 RepID=A0A1B8U5D1_9FLAO|nr:molybdopterin-synthase adenylyltransferase MoeB [Polaribacter reichenbachii]APZ47595.1 dinucleotide-utilizing protein [Polaribacter reichenbachii]AUC18235.1 dinucleotide-utilizing protein [Polaribacter reichenbachii]OBY67053.1 dinucleotide-utilizing protein [Polaribacter reichenbachii]
MLTSEEKKQYNRHLILDKIGEKGQLKLKQAKVLVIGAGGLGCPVLQYLTAAGVGTIGIIDDDVVDQSNLQRQILYTIDDIGVSKALTASKRLSKLNPFVKFDVYQEQLTRENAVSLFEKYDIIVDGSDNFSTRYLTNDASIITKKPLVYGAIFKFEGQVSVFNFNGSGSYRCLYPTPPKPNESPNCSEIGVLGVLPGIIGSFQANEVIKMICEIGEVLTNKVLIYDTLTMRQLTLKFEKSEKESITKLEEDYDFFCGIKSVKNEITIDEVEKNIELYNLLDVREEYEHEDFNIGGQNIPLSELDDRFDEVDIQKPIVVYCASGLRSKKAIDILKENNKNIILINLKNGCF